MRCLCWLDEDYVLVGCLDGIVHLWRIGGEIRVSDLTLPFLSFYSLFFPFFLSLSLPFSCSLSLPSSSLFPLSLSISLSLFPVIPINGRWNYSHKMQ